MDLIKVKTLVTENADCFHVLFRKEEGVWKILMDYDSSEGNTIGAEHFLNAYHIEDFSTFVED